MVARDEGARNEGARPGGDKRFPRVGGPEAGEEICPEKEVGVARYPGGQE